MPKTLAIKKNNNDCMQSRAEGAEGALIKATHARIE